MKTAADLGATILDETIGDLITGIYDPKGYGTTSPAEPFYGRLIAGMKRVTCTEADKGKPNYVPTAAVAIKENTIVLLVNLDFLNKYDQLSRRAIIKHEAQHIAHRHLFRFKEGRYSNMPRANIAMDAVINQFNPEFHGMLDKETQKRFEAIDYKKIPDHTNKGAPAPADRSWQFYYELLEQESDEKTNGETGEDGITSTAYGDMFDDHSFFGQFDENTNPDLVHEKLKDQIQKCARQAYAGTTPKEIEDILEEIRKESRIPWQVLLRNWMKQSVRQIREMHILRESLCVPGVFPGHKRVPVPEFHVYADMSGSIADDQAVRFFGEVMAIQAKMKATIHLHQFDTQIHKSETLDKQVPKIKRAACGGTNFDCIVEHAKENRIKNFIVMTDGYCPETNFTGFNVLMAYTENHQKHENVVKSIIIDNT